MQPGSLAIAARHGVGRGRPGRALVIAHRGAWERSAPQNSLAAFELAIAAGADAVELDVRRTVDGCLVVVHDSRVRGRRVARLEHERVRDRVRDGQAPELEEVLEALAGRIGVDIELKEDGYVEAVMATVARRLAPDQYVVTSFREAVLPAVKRLAPDARTGLLLAPRRRTVDLGDRVRETRVDFVAPNVRLARAGLLDWAAARGLPSWVWTVNEPRALADLLDDPRVAAVITDRLDRALPATRRSGAPTPRAA